MKKAFASRDLAPLLLAAASITSHVTAATTTTVVDIPVSGGVTQRILYMRPDAPIATIVSIPGGDGTYLIQDDGSIGNANARCNPPYRTRQSFVDQGFAMAFVDQDSANGIYDLNDIGAVMRYVRSKDNVPVWAMGGSASTGVTLTLGGLSADAPQGIVVFSPGPYSTSTANAVRRPAYVINNSLDGSTVGFAATLFPALTSATVRDHSTLNGTTDTACGAHLFQGLDEQFVAGTSAFMKANNVQAAPVSNFNVQGMWWRGLAESGWGINLVHQGNTAFGTWFTYDTDGTDLWLVMDNLQLVANDTWSGNVFRTSGSAFGVAPYDNTRFATTLVGTATFTFSDANNGSVTWTVNGTTLTKPITKFAYQSPMPTCAKGAVQGGNVNYQDLWWPSPARSENGIGYNILHQGDTLFVTWFTYDTDGTGMWLFMDNAAKTGNGTYSGDVKQARGSPVNVTPYDTSRFSATTVGTGTFTFTSAGSGTFSYTVKGFTQSKAITRFVFSDPVTTCVFP